MKYNFVHEAGAGQMVGANRVSPAEKSVVPLYFQVLRLLVCTGTSREKHTGILGLQRP